MKFGICTPWTNAQSVAAAGWDYIEESVQAILQGTVDDANWTQAQKITASELPVPVANLLVPAAIKITGPAADLPTLQKYMTRVLSRAPGVGIKTLVFGSGGARNVPDGFDRVAALNQIIEFLRISAPIAARHGVTIVIEPLNRRECNIINSVEEAIVYIKTVNHPNVQCLVDSYHFWLENEPLESLENAMPWIRHVHLADTEGRVAPGQSGKADYLPFFRVLKNGGYDSLMSFEGTAMLDFENTAPKVLAFIKKQWSEA
jgi:sugar phosphate isomerase/epimerase